MNKTYIPVTLARFSRSSREGCDVLWKRLSSIPSCALENLFRVRLRVDEVPVLEVVVSDEILVVEEVRESLGWARCMAAAVMMVVEK